MDLRDTAEGHDAELKTAELGAVLWWGAWLRTRGGSSRGGQEEDDAGWLGDTFFRIHAMMFETMSSLSLLWLAEDMIRQMEAEGVRAERGN